VLPRWKPTSTPARAAWKAFQTLKVAEVLFDDAAAFSNINTLEDCSTTNATHRRTSRTSVAVRAGCRSAALPVEEAQRLICERITPVDASETLPLLNALDRVLAADIISPINVPAYDNSAMDGYALRGADLPADGAQLQRHRRRLRRPSVHAGAAARRMRAHHDRRRHSARLRHGTAAGAGRRD
jgi:hypothetical protein